MLSDYQIIARLLVAFRASEGEKRFNVGYIDAGFIPCPWDVKVRLAPKLQKANIIEGIEPYDTDGMGVWWHNSHPTITITGLTYIENDRQIQKELTKLRNQGAMLPAPLANAVISLSAEPDFDNSAE